LAAERSGVALKIPKIGSFRTSVTAESNETLSLVDSLNVRGQHAAARAVLDLALQTNLLSENNLGEVLIQKMLESQNYRKAIDLANKSFDDAVFAFGPVSGSTQPAFAALWPDAFHAEINKIAKDVGLQTGAIQGLMREETLFQRTARSWVGARGLMQLMPATAKLVIKGHGLTSLNPDINDINTNITLGATYLKDMLDRFDGKLPFAVMAYNAGPGNVSKWLKRNPNKELDEFIELIPISETRNYVKRVMRSAAVYCAQHGEKFDATF
jgi:soluble lytic murein transglycosylase-like protein